MMSKGRRDRPLMRGGRPLRWILPLAVLVGLLLLQWLAPGWAARAEAWTIDARFSLRGGEEPRHPIVIVALDDDSFQMLGALSGENIRTWPRARWAELVDRIASGNPRVIGLDVVLDTPGRDEGGDESLAGALRRAQNVVLPIHVVLRGEGMVGTENMLSPPLDVLSEAAAGVGIANFPTDADGAIRRAALLYPFGGQHYPYFPLVVATLFNRAPVDVDRAALDDFGSFSIHFRGSEGTFQTIPVYRVLADELVTRGDIDESEVVDPAVFRDAIVLVGYTTQLEQDRHVTPFAGSAGMPGVEIQANAVDTLLAGDWLIRPPAWLVMVLVGAGGLVALIMLNLGRPGLGVAILVGVVAAYLVLGQALFSWREDVLPIVTPLVAAVAVGGTALAERMIFAEREKRQLRQRLAGVMSPERLQAVMENWEALLQSERPRKEAAVLFADVRGFTHATETLMHEGRSPEMVRFLSAYLDAMAEAVFAEGGVIYDVVGDGLMILFGVPEPLPDYALRAVRAAVNMALATHELQALWPLRDQRPLGMGIGLHCGQVVDAVVGRGRRINYAVIGDPVNTAARIEAHCKVAMEIPRPPGGQVPETITVLISADLYEQVRAHVLVDEGIPPFEARGKSEPLRVLRLLGLQEDA